MTASPAYLGRVRSLATAGAIALFSCGGATSNDSHGASDAAADHAPFAEAASDTNAADASDATDALPLGCCNAPSDCGDFVYQPCVQHRCVDVPSASRCWDSTQCPADSHCEGVQLCGCGLACFASDTVGTCVSGVDAATDGEAGSACEAGVWCVAGCGSGALSAPKCTAGQLSCDPGLVRTDSCPPGTCFEEFGGPHCCQSGHIIPAWCDAPGSNPLCLDGSTAALTATCDGGTCPPIDYCP